MSTPKGMRHVAVPLVSGDHVMLYSNAENIILQLRRQVPTEAALLESSFKVAVQLSPAEAARIAWELLNSALPRLLSHKEKSAANEQLSKAGSSIERTEKPNG